MEYRLALFNLNGDIRRVVCFFYFENGQVRLNAAMKSYPYF